MSIVLDRQQYGLYAKLHIGPGRISLGPIDETSPTALLDVALRAMESLTVNELKRLRDSDKTMREGQRKPGRPRKYARI